MKIDWLDHFVLTVKDISVTCEFYSNVLGMNVISFGEGRKARRQLLSVYFRDPNLNLIEVSNDLEAAA